MQSSHFSASVGMIPCTLALHAFALHDAILLYLYFFILSGLSTLRLKQAVHFDDLCCFFVRIVWILIIAGKGIWLLKVFQ